MEIVYKQISDLKPYAKNPRRNDQAVEYVANSIKEFGFKVPIVIDKNNEIVCGHTRYKASKKLHIQEVPCVIADDLNEEQIKAFRLADNKVSEMADWDLGLLTKELDDIYKTDMYDLGFDVAELFGDHETYKKDTQEREANILNLEKAQFVGVGKYDIPQIEPVYELPEIKEWIGFNYVLSDKNPEGKAVHFFLNDYQFERVWNNPEAYLDKLRQYVCVATPDFSPYANMPMATQIYNHYRKHWLGAYWQQNGINVIPTIRANTNPNCLEWFLDGEPKGGIILSSNMWSTSQDTEVIQKVKGMVYETLKPVKWFVYGSAKDIEYDIMEHIESYSERKWK